MKEAVSALLFAALISAASHAAENSDSHAAKPLDLKPADIRKLFTPRQIAKTLSGDNIEKVEVIGSPVLLPQKDSEFPMPWAGPAAAIWALLHPTQAWRIVAPVLPEQAARLNGAPDLDQEMFRIVAR